MSDPEGSEGAPLNPTSTDTAESKPISTAKVAPLPIEGAITLAGGDAQEGDDDDYLDGGSSDIKLEPVIKRQGTMDRVKTTKNILEALEKKTVRFRVFPGAANVTRCNIC